MQWFDFIIDFREDTGIFVAIYFRDNRNINPNFNLETT